jgi:hypothetical protein
MGLSKATIHRLLSWSAQQGKVENLGDGNRHAFYRIVADPSSRKKTA